MEPLLHSHEVCPVNVLTEELGEMQVPLNPSTEEELFHVIQKVEKGTLQVVT